MIKRIIDYIKHLLRLDDPVQAELRNLSKQLSHIKPPYYKLSSNLVLPGLAQDLFLFCSALKPLMDIADRTLAHPDVRVSKKFFDAIIDSRLPPEVLEKKSEFVYEGMKPRIENAIKTNDAFEEINRDFQNLLRHLENIVSSNINAELFEVQRFVDICRHDWERLLSFFDPAVSLEDRSYALEAQPCDGDQLSPEIIDVYFLTLDFMFSDALLVNFMKTFARHAPESAKSQEQRITNIFATLNKILKFRLASPILLALARLARKDPGYQPFMKHEVVDYIGEYRKRIVVQFEKDRERLQRERHETAVATDIRNLFGDQEVFIVDGYDDSTDQYLRRESPLGFTHIKALGILKTFVHGVFEQEVKESIKRILVEGYFDNKIYQNNLANIIYQCDRTITRISSFEQGLRSNNKVSITSIRRYVDEIRHGKDMLSFLARMVEEINQNARSICEDETGLFQMLSDAIGELLADYRKSSPDIVTNIRTLGGTRNKEIISGLLQGRKQLDTFIRIMRNFAVIKNSPSTSPIPAAAPPMPL